MHGGTRSELAAMPAKPLQRETYRAWRIVPEKAEATPLPSGHADSLKDALDKALTGCVQHKDHVAILVTDTVTGKRMVHFHAIKRQSAPLFRWDAETQRQVRTYKLYPVEVFAMAVNEFVPVEPWHWSPGADVVGNDDGGVIEGNRL